jgi:hypothetical protein
MNIQQQKATQAFGKVLGVTMNDLKCQVFPLPDQESIIFIKSERITKPKEFLTGVVKLDSQGDVLLSRLLDCDFEIACRLSNGSFY